MANVIDHERGLRVNVRNQCGPQRKIVSVDDSGPGWTLVTNSCGHVAQCASHFHYKIGTEHSCFDCRFADDNVISQEKI
jgi:transposase